MAGGELVAGPQHFFHAPCQGAEECDDFNDYGGDGCSATCLWEIKEVASWSQTEVMVEIRPLGQICRTGPASSSSDELIAMTCAPFAGSTTRDSTRRLKT